MRISSPAKCVICDGPYADVDRDGDEVPTWSVCIGDDEGEPCGTVYRCSTFTGAVKLARDIARDRRLELVMEASPA
jgi:hypothetical protein